ncbi:MAG: hypothetical protein HYZ72_12425 [Deltaproteobacteria bacterium]|nr:hypothetical protein [Deltaproteobacteria bacterium]
MKTTVLATILFVGAFLGVSFAQVVEPPKPPIPKPFPTPEELKVKTKEVERAIKAHKQLEEIQKENTRRIMRQVIQQHVQIKPIEVKPIIVPKVVTPKVVVPTQMTGQDLQSPTRTPRGGSSFGGFGGSGGFGR